MMKQLLNCTWQGVGNYLLICKYCNINCIHHMNLLWRILWFSHGCVWVWGWKFRNKCSWGFKNILYIIETEEVYFSHVKVLWDILCFSIIMQKRYTSSFVQYLKKLMYDCFHIWYVDRYGREDNWGKIGTIWLLKAPKKRMFSHCGPWDIGLTSSCCAYDLLCDEVYLPWNFIAQGNDRRPPRPSK